MPDQLSRPAAPDPTVPPQTLADRLMERVRQAALAVEQAADEVPSRPRRRASDARRRAGNVSQTREQVREARSLRRVFLDMGDSYRDYRRRTGAPVSAEVRGAADRFRREQDVSSLAAVAASLDELHVLTW